MKLTQNEDDKLITKALQWLISGLAGGVSTPAPIPEPQKVMLLVFGTTSAVRLQQEIEPDEDGVLRFRIGMDSIIAEFNSDRALSYFDPFDEEDPEQHWTR